MEVTTWTFPCDRTYRSSSTFLATATRRDFTVSVDHTKFALLVVHVVNAPQDDLIAVHALAEVVVDDVLQVVVDNKASHGIQSIQI